MTDDPLLATLRANLIRFWMWHVERSGMSAPDMERAKIALQSLFNQPHVMDGGLRFSDVVPETRFISDLFPAGLPGLLYDRELSATAIAPDHRRLATSVIIGDSAAIRTAIDIVLRLAPSSVPMLIMGETGTGKELFAELAHRASLVKAGPLVTVNCAAVPESLIMAELFGFEPGSFTGAAPRGRQGKVETAHGGTLFLDEIGDLPLSGQAALLRFLDTGEVQKIGRGKPARVQSRIVCATHHDLPGLVAENKFRRDLFFRIALVPVTVPPLRERLGDLPALIGHFLRMFRARYRRDHPDSVSREAMRELHAHSWPGNVRELMFTLERAFLLCADRQIAPANIVLGEVRREDVVSGLETIIAARLSLARPTLFRDRKKWAAYLAHHAECDISTGDAAREFELSEASVRIRLAALVQMGVLSAAGVKKGRKYRLCLSATTL